MNKRAFVKHILTLCAAYTLGQRLLFQVKDPHELAASYLYWPALFLVICLVLLPIYLLGRKHPNAAWWSAWLLLCLSAVLLGLVFLLVILLLLNRILHFWY